MLAEPAATKAAAARLHDASDDVRCAAVRLIGSWLLAGAPALRPSAAPAAAAAAPASVADDTEATTAAAVAAADVGVLGSVGVWQLVAEVARVSDVAAGTAFAVEYRHLAAALQGSMPAVWAAAAAAAKPLAGGHDDA